MLKALGQLAAITAVLAVALVVATGPAPELLPSERDPLYIIGYEFGTWIGLFALSVIVAGIAAAATRRPNTAVVAGSLVAAALTALNLVGRQI